MFNRLVIIFGFTFGSIWLAVYTYSYFWGKKKLIRTFKEIDRANIKDCMDGDVVRIQGELVSLNQYLTAPLSLRKCSVYTLRVSIEVDRVTTSGTGTHVKNETAWETLKYAEIAEDFLIRCGEHFALIRTDGANLIVRSDTTYDEVNYDREKDGFLSEHENEKRKRVLKAIGISPKQYIGIYAKNVKLEEGVLEPDASVAVLGNGKWVSRTETNNSEYLEKLGIEKVFEIGYSDEHKLYISDSKFLLDDVK